MKYVGIDWAKDEHVVALLDESGAVLDEWRVRHEPGPVRRLVDRLTERGGPDQVRVALEPGVPLLTDLLLVAGYTVYEINPKQSDRFRDRHGPAGAKDDRRDAIVLADAIRTDSHRLQPAERDSALTEELALRDRARSRLVRQRTRYANQLQEVLARYHPALLRIRRDMHDRFLIALLRAYPDPVAARRGQVSRLRRLLRENRVRAIGVDELVALLRGPGFPVPAHVVAACRDEAVDLVDQIELLNRQIRKAEDRLDELFEGHPDREVLLSLPGLGDRLATRVIGELGDRRAHCGDPTIVRTFAGTAPVTKRSGKRSRQVVMRRGCNRNLQAALYTMARCSLARSTWARAFVAHQMRGKQSYAAALRSLSNKWAKILTRLLADGTPYDENVHVERLVQNRVPWIEDTRAGKVPA